MHRGNLYISIILTVIFILFTSRVAAQFEHAKLLVLYDSAWTYKNLKLIPVRYRQEPGSTASPIDGNIKVISLSEAIRKNQIKINELPKNVGADVSVLKVLNESKDYVLINSGEVVSGGKQDRASGETVLLPPEEEDYYLKTYCVEKGRWSKREKKFKYYQPSELFVKKIIDVEKNQAHVWNAIEHKFRDARLETDSWAYADYINVIPSPDDSGYIKYYISKYNESDSNYAGFIAITADRIIVTDLYATSQLTTNAFPAILHTYIRSAIAAGDTPRIPDPEVMQFMTPIFSDPKTRKEFLDKHGTTHYFKSKAIHIVAYGD